MNDNENVCQCAKIYRELADDSNYLIGVNVFDVFMNVKQPCVKNVGLIELCNSHTKFKTYLHDGCISTIQQYIAWMVKQLKSNFIENWRALCVCISI